MSGGILSGKQICIEVERSTIKIDPFRGQQVNQASYDLRLNPYYRTYTLRGDRVLDAASENESELQTMPSGGLLLQPGVGYLMCTIERIDTGPFVGVVDGKSSMGRLFVFAHVTAGYIDPQFEGHVTLEVIALHPTIIYSAMRFAQMRFHTVVGECESYQHRGHYTGSNADGPVASMSWKQIAEDREERRRGENSSS